MLVTWEHKELIGLRGESDVALKGKGRIYLNIHSSTSSSSSKWKCCFTKCLSIALCCCSYSPVLSWQCVFPGCTELRNRWSILCKLSATNLHAGKQQIVWKTRPNLHFDSAVLCCAACRNALNVCTSPTEQLTKDRRQESLITFRVHTVAAGLGAHCIKSSLCSLHAINQTM